MQKIRWDHPEEGNLLSGKLMELATNLAHAMEMSSGIILVQTWGHYSEEYSSLRCRQFLKFVPFPSFI